MSGDNFQFDSQGDGPARYNIIHFKKLTDGEYGWVNVGEYKDEQLSLNLSRKHSDTYTQIYKHTHTCNFINYYFIHYIYNTYRQLSPKRSQNVTHFIRILRFLRAWLPVVVIFRCVDYSNGWNVF